MPKEVKETSLHEKLWASAQQLRANSSLKLNEISEPILGLIFLKFAEVRFNKAQDQIEAERTKSESGRPVPITPDTYKSRGILYVPDNASFNFLMQIPESQNLGKAVNEAMESIEEVNTELAGILPKDYTELSRKTDENNRILLNLLRNFNQITIDTQQDTFGEIYEYFLGEFARSEGQKGGEFFTPKSIVNLIVEILEPYQGRIYDPACGSGGMFVQSAEFIEAHSKNKESVLDDISIYGQEKVEGNVRISKMNLAIHGLSGDIKNTNTYYEDPFKSVGRFDFVMANPPFNVKGKDKNKQIIIDPARIKEDPRYLYGLPTTGKGEITNANYLWIQLFASALSSKGRAGFVMANSAADAGNAEKEIRRKLIESGIVDCIVSVGSNMFLNATLSCTLWFFDKGKLGTERQNRVLFINAQDIFTVVDRAHSTWTPDQIQEIAKLVRSYREESDSEKYQDIKGRCKVVDLDLIKKNDYSLNPGRYIETVNQEISEEDFQDKFQKLQKEFLELTKESHSIEEKIIKDWESI